MPDNLQRMFDLQEELNAAMPDAAKFGTRDLYERDPELATRLLKETVLAMMTELGELLEWTNWKPWKQLDPDLPDVMELRKEIADLMHYVVNLSLTWGMTPSALMVTFEWKHAENMRRQREGY